MPAAMALVTDQLQVIDSVKLANAKQTLRGTLPVAGFDRLRDSLWSEGEVANAGQVDYEVGGDADARARPVLQLKVSGRVWLQCQRCLGGFEHELAVDTTLRLVPEASLEAEHSDDPDEPDCIAASRELDLAALIEDEILLALPAYPRHSVNDSSCRSDAEKMGSNQVSAFSALGQLDALKQKAFTSKE